jgi:hypothetical protein
MLKSARMHAAESRIAQAFWAVVGVLALVLTIAQPAAAAPPTQDCDDGVVITCGVGVGTPGGGGGGTQPEPGNPNGNDGAPVDFTPGPTTCKFGDEEVPCSTPDGWYSNNSKCVGYVKVQDPQTTPPSGKNAAVGAWYACTTYCPPGNTCYGATFWSDTPPAGIVTYTPAQAAALLVKRFQLRGIDIGMAPESKIHADDPAGTAPYRRTWVGIPVWLWANNPEPLNYGPYTETATLGGVTVTATAKVSSVTWSSGDGQKVTCAAGTPFDAAEMKDKAAQDSPTCGFRYQKTSGDGTFTVTATSHWTVSWTGGGTEGTIAVRDTSSTATVRVGELQSVNTDAVDPLG